MDKNVYRIILPTEGFLEKYFPSFLEDFPSLDKKKLSNDKRLDVIYKEESKEDSLNFIADIVLRTAVEMEISKMKDMQDEVRKMTYENEYFKRLIMLEVKRYFTFNNTLNLNSFITFNLNGISKDINEIYMDLKEEQVEEGEDFYNAFKEQIKSYIDINDYSELVLSYDDNILVLTNKKGQKLTPNNIQNKIGVSISVTINDEWEKDLYFCQMICSFLDVKVLRIPFEYKDMYEFLKPILPKTTLILEN